MPAAMDYIGSFMITDGSTATTIPVRQGSEYRWNRVPQGFAYAQNGVLEASAWTDGQAAPQLTIRTHMFSTWAIPAFLNRLLGLPLGTKRDVATHGGLMQPFGACAWQYGGEALMTFTKCYCESLVLRWADLGDPIDVTMGFRVAGARQNVDAWTGGAATPFYGRYTMGKGVTFKTTAGSPSLDKVHAGSLAWSQDLSPDFSTPYTNVNGDTTNLAGDGRDPTAYPKAYFSAPPTWMLSVTQDLAGTPAESEVQSRVTAYVNCFAPGDVSLFPLSASFKLTGLAPDRQEAVAMNLGLRTRTYRSIAPVAGTDSVAIVAPVALQHP